MKASLLILINAQHHFRFIATIIGVRVRVRVRVRVVTLGLRFLGLRQPKVRAKFRLRVLIPF